MIKDVCVSSLSSLSASTSATLLAFFQMISLGRVKKRNPESGDSVDDVQMTRTKEDGHWHSLPV